MSQSRCRDIFHYLISINRTILQELPKLSPLPARKLGSYTCKTVHMTTTELLPFHAVGTSPDAAAQADSNIETQFANVLHSLQVNKQRDPFDIIQDFKQICADRALSTRDKLSLDESNTALAEEFDNWDLEFKLWELVDRLFRFRALFSNKAKTELLREYDFSSMGIKQENFLRKNPAIRELSIIILWLQSHTPSLVGDETESYQTKWKNTAMAVANSDFDVLASRATDADLIDKLDIDAPLRSNRSIHPADESNDSKVFAQIYKLLLQDRVQDAIDIANNTGNYALALILVGATQEYFDPVLDKQDSDFDSIVAEQTKPSGIKHKLLWKKTVYKLSQQANLNKYEKLIYNYLCGGDISGNLSVASDDWEQTLLLYLSQLYSYNIDNFIVSQLSSEQEILPVNIPKPQLNTIAEILNTISHSGNLLTQQSENPLRVIMGSVMLDNVPSLLHNLTSSSTGEPEALKKPYISRVLTHLAIFQLLVVGTDNINNEDITTIITSYTSKLAEYKLPELIPIYLSFVPNEKDSREAYALFLSSLTDSSDRSKQIEISRRIANSISEVDEAMELAANTQEDKMMNVLRRTVERVMKDTESHYKPQAVIEVQDDINSVDDIDSKLYHSVEWFYENKMYEDAIVATIAIIRRFLLCGKLAPLKAFSKGKNFKLLLVEYDTQLQTKSLIFQNEPEIVTEEDKEELLAYASLIEGLILIDEWKKFVSTQINSQGKWLSTGVDSSIDKTSKTLLNLIFKWFKNTSSEKDSDLAIYSEFRSIYVPYLIIELLKIFQNAREKDWKYMRSAFSLINDVANEEQNDFLSCFLKCGRLDEFLVKAGEVSIVAVEKGISGIFY
ncbi:Nucleoporin NUP84 (Nuclear pore protein NUP84) [Scheffersomyces stipitis CBS 6054]|uniref:Nuclear pore complex protein n=1 Tax=Scheffersomyces stipitis (strain ATCC 58785 / CBS 6054 / NBRC 10063 / NRRL Y-11545) TaxID=322104 RepID=A3LTN9_PICST|nr:Nucleoporin NUP84 (Nuclear pore protein NUP84) [Scheffersomyces stipitis CBS 6054]ABN66448.2 Nucleoporin NUP84 (Nuclear pore protein NUP84) [Scheffersomyces stipitis CBS 6054]